MIGSDPGAVCLIVANGFSEWEKPKDRGTKQPYFFTLKDESPMAFAGVWERWEDMQASGQIIESCSILTTSPNELTSQVHDPMPVIVKQEHDNLWLDHSVQGCAKLAPVLRPYRAEEMKMVPVSTAVGSPRNDAPSIIEPIGAVDWK